MYFAQTSRPTRLMDTSNSSSGIGAAAEQSISASCSAPLLEPSTGWCTTVSSTAALPWMTLECNTESMNARQTHFSGSLTTPALEMNQIEGLQLLVSKRKAIQACSSAQPCAGPSTVQLKAFGLQHVRCAHLLCSPATQSTAAHACLAART